MVKWIVINNEGNISYKEKYKNFDRIADARKYAKGKGHMRIVDYNYMHPVKKTKVVRRQTNAFGFPAVRW